VGTRLQQSAGQAKRFRFGGAPRHSHLAAHAVFEFRFGLED
jgi:hypothetical protein